MTRWSVIIGVAAALLGGSAASAQESRDLATFMPEVFEFVSDSTEILTTPPFPAASGHLEAACLEDASDSAASLSPDLRMLFEHWIYDELGLHPGYDCSEGSTSTGLIDRRARPAVRIVLSITYPSPDSVAASFRVISPTASFGWFCRFEHGAREPSRCSDAQG